MFSLGMILWALLFTNVWIFLYTKNLFILNTLFPQSINHSFLWVQFAPEPFEIPLYLVITAGLTLLLYTTIRMAKALDRISLPIKVFSILLLLLSFLYSIGQYPQANSFDPYQPRLNESVYTVATTSYILATIVICLALVGLNRFTKNTRLASFFVLSFVGLVIAIATFDAQFPMVGHDYEYFIGPASEVMMGKTVYTDILSRYGFLTIDLFAFFAKLNLFSLFYIPFIVWILYTVQYLLCFYLVRKVSRSTVFSVLSIGSILTVNYFSLSHLPGTIPQIGPLRWLPMVITLVLLYKIKKINSFSFIILVSLFSFFMIDVGIALLMAYLATIGSLFFLKKIDLKKLMQSVFFLVVSLLLTLCIINVFHLLFNYKTVDILTPLYSFRKHAILGLSLIPIDMRTHFWFVPLIYFASIIYLFRYQNQRESENRHLGRIELSHQLLLFSANLSLFASVYFVGRSHPHNLFHISLFPLLNLFILLGFFLQSAKFSKQKKIFLYLAVFVIFIAYPAFQRRFTLSEMILTKITRLKMGKIFRSEVESIIKTKYKKDLKLIQSLIAEDEVVILSVDDSYLFSVLGKKNLLAANPIMGIDLPEDLEFAVKNAAAVCPAKIVSDCSFIGKCQPYTPFIGVNFNLNLLLDKLEEKCRVQYEPMNCSDHLCILQKRNL